MKQILYFCLCISLFSCQHKNDTIPTLTSEKKEDYSPNDWMYNQRAYPHGELNYTTYLQAIKQAKIAQQQNENKSNQTWELVGPLNTGGRITDVALDPNNENIIYAGASIGGIFKSTDKGINWLPIFDEQNTLSIGNIAIAPSNPNILYVGTGEANGSATSGAFFGDGVYKSTDAGSTWTHAGLSRSQHIGRIVVDSQNPDRVFVAAAGTLYGKDDEKGLYRTYDGGDTWEQVLFVSDSTSCIDVVLHPSDPNIIYTATWERIRYPWQRSYGGVTSRIYRSEDGGDTWEHLINGLPPSDENRGRIGLSISVSDPHILYASFTENPITNRFEGLYKTMDGGDTWTQTNDDELSNVFGSFGWFFGNVRVDPSNPDIVYVMGVTLYKSENGGQTWQEITNGMHVDQHGLEMHPLNSNFVVAGNDGGVYLSENGGQSWSHIETLPITQFYHCEVNFENGNAYYGGTQDNGTIRTLTGVDNDWERILGGDGFHVIVDPNDNNFIYAESQWGGLNRSVDGGQNMTWAAPDREDDERNNWNTPVVMDPANSATIYYGTNKLYRSVDRAVNWTRISDDLTKGLHPSGSLSFGTITTIAPAPSDSETIYIGTDDGNVQVTRDAGNTWINISAGLPDRTVTRVAVDYDDANIAFVTFSGYRYLDYQPHILMTEDGGDSWVDISSNLPEVPINDVVIDPDQTHTLYVATDLGVWQSLSGGDTWEVLGTGLPLTVIPKLVYNKWNRHLVAATFGRSMQTIDLGSPLSNHDPIPIAANKLNVFPNPIQKTTTVQFELPIAQKGHLALYQMNGQLLKTFEATSFSSGQNKIQLTLPDLVAGQYIIRLAMEDAIYTQRVTVL